jgi:hypothetical protein
VLIDIIGIAQHRRSHGQGVFVFDPLHYLVLIETKPNALDQAAPLQDWDLSEAFQHVASASSSGFCVQTKLAERHLERRDRLGRHHFGQGRRRDQPLHRGRHEEGWQCGRDQR